MIRHETKSKKHTIPPVMPKAILFARESGEIPRLKTRTKGDLILSLNLFSIHSRVHITKYCIFYLTLKLSDYWIDFATLVFFFARRKIVLLVFLAQSSYFDVMDPISRYEILKPVIGLISWTFVMWFWMYAILFAFT